MTVEVVATDWGTVGQRRASKSPPSQGGWSIFHGRNAGADSTNPASYLALRANGEKAFFGWPERPEVETQVTAWFDAKDTEEEKAAMQRLNKAAMEHVVYIPLGFYVGRQAWRTNVNGVTKGPLPFFWGVSKS
jgi:peptide/nickel transport system substrate-binding protein